MGSETMSFVKGKIIMECPKCGAHAPNLISEGCPKCGYKPKVRRRRRNE
jgi:ribosomal protein L37E